MLRRAYPGGTAPPPPLLLLHCSRFRGQGYSLGWTQGPEAALHRKARQAEPHFVLVLLFFWGATGFFFPPNQSDRERVDKGERSP